MKLIFEIRNSTTMNTLITYFKKCGLVLILLLTTLFFTKQSVGQTVVTNPTSPWTVPANVNSVKVEVWGGGGGGGAANSGFYGTGAGGGGGGGTYNTDIFSVTPGHTFTITKGGGGNAGNGGNGGSGGTTTVTGVDGTISGNGGGGGGYGNGGNGSAGSAGTGGIHNGGIGGTANGNGAGGGGGAGNNENGGNGGNTTTGSGGAGSPNNAPYTGGNGGAYRTNNGTGNTGIAPGGGGGGGRISGGYNKRNNGGIGGAGQVVITYTVCVPPAAPTATSPVAYCKNASATALTATGSSLLWYTTATGGTGSSTAPTPVTTTVGSTPYYVSQTIGCESPRANINVIVNALPIASVPDQNNISCYGGADGSITISGSGGTGLYTFSKDDGASFQPATGTGSWQFTGLQAGTPYHIKVKDTNGCISN